MIYCMHYCGTVSDLGAESCFLLEEESHPTLAHRADNQRYH